MEFPKGALSLSERYGTAVKGKTAKFRLSVEMIVYMTALKQGRSINALMKLHLMNSLRNVEF